jgi:hypothetical protein
MSILNDLSPNLIPLTALLIPIVAIIGSVVLKIQRLQLLHETVRQISASGQPVPPELLKKIIDGK